MRGNVSINIDHAPKDWKSFKRWHPLSTDGVDPMTAEERFESLGGVIPKKDVDRTDSPAKAKK